MIKLYYVDTGTGSSDGWCTSLHEAKQAVSSLVKTCGSEYANTETETHCVRTMPAHMLSSASKYASPAVKKIAQRELNRRDAIIDAVFKLDDAERDYQRARADDRWGTETAKERYARLAPSRAEKRKAETRLRQARKA